MLSEYTYRLRKDSEPHPGHMVLVIDGVDTEYTNDPSQHVEKMLTRIVKKRAKGSDKNLAISAAEQAEKQAQRVLARVAERIQKGFLIPGGVNLAAPRGANVGITRDFDEKLIKEIAETNRMSSDEREERAVRRFLGRGKLAGLDDKKRAARLKRHKFDNDADWKARRKALIDDRTAKLREVEKAIAKTPAGDTEGPEGKVVNKKEELLRKAFALKLELEGLKAKVLAASHGLQYANGQFLQAAINVVTGDIRIWPLMTNTTLDTVRDAVDTFGDVTADEFDGANYSPGGLPLDNQAVNIDDANDRAEFDSDDEMVASLGAGTRSILGVASGLFNTNTAASMPIYWHEFATVKTPDGSNFTFTINAEGLLQL